MTWSKPKIVSKCSSAARFFSGFPLTCWQVTYERLLQQFYLLSCPIDSSFRSWWWAPWHFLTLKYLDTTFVKRHFAPSAEFSCWWWKWSKCVERSPGEGISSRPVLVLMFVTRDHLMEQPSSIDFKTHLRYDAFLKRRGQWGDPTLSLELLPVHDACILYMLMIMMISMMAGSTHIGHGESKVGWWGSGGGENLPNRVKVRVRTHLDWAFYHDCRFQFLIDCCKKRTNSWTVPAFVN